MRASLSRPFIFLTDEEREKKNVKETHLKGTFCCCLQTLRHFVEKLNRSMIIIIERSLGWTNNS